MFGKVEVVYILILFIKTFKRFIFFQEAVTVIQ